MKKNNVKRPILAENIYLTKSEKNILNFVNSFEDSEFNLSQAELAKLANSSGSSLSVGLLENITSKTTETS